MLFTSMPSLMISRAFIQALSGEEINWTICSAWLVTQGEREEDVGSHAGMHDTASLMFLNPAMLRPDKLASGTRGDGSGVVGNPARSTAAYGEQILDMQIDAAVRQIRTLRQRGNE